MNRDHPDPPPAAPYLVLALVALTLALVTTAEHWASMQRNVEDPTWHTVAHALKSELPRWGAWLLAVPAARWLLRRSRWDGWHAVGWGLAHALLAALVIVTHRAVVLAVHRLIGFPTGDRPFWTTFRGMLSPGMIPTALAGYAAVVGAALSIDYYLRYRERAMAAAALDRELAEARLHALEQQLNPHFLFNALNTVSMLVRRGDGPPAVEMLARLSQFLRVTLDAGRRHEIPLASEMAQVDRYLEIERLRFGDRLAVRIDVPADAGDGLVPALAVQHLVENAIRHGVAGLREGGSVTVRAGHAGDRLVVEVIDNGPGPTPHEGGTGLANTRARLAALHGGQATLTLERGPSGGAVARLDLPFRTEP